MGITSQQALDCFASDDLIGIGMEADAVRRDLHPEDVVTYTIDCSLPCIVSDPQALDNTAHTAIDLGATGLALQPAADKPLKLSEYESLLSRLKQRFPGVCLQGSSATEILSLARAASLSLIDTIARLRDAGLDSLASSGAILHDDLRRRLTPNKCTPTEWLAVHRTAHQLGLPSIATMAFGIGETTAQRVSHLEFLRNLQEDTGGFTAFVPQPPDTNRPADEPTAVEYLTTLAVGRLYLDNIPNLQGSWTTQGLKVLQMSLRFGGNDVGSVLLEKHPGKPGGATEEELRRIIRDAGFRPAQRDTLYRTMFLS